MMHRYLLSILPLSAILLLASTLDAAPAPAPQAIAPSAAALPAPAELAAKPDPAQAAAPPETVPASPPEATAAAATAEAPAASAESSEGQDDDAANGKTLVLQDPQVRVDLESRLKSLDGAGLAADEQQAAAAHYQEALKSFDIAKQQTLAAQRFQQKLDSLPEDVREQTKLLEKRKPYDDVSGLPLAKVEETANNVASWVNIYREQLAEIEAEPKRRAQRLAELPKQISDAQRRLTEATEQLTSLGSEDVTNTVAVARRAALGQRVQALQATLDALEREQRLYQQGGEWVKLRRDFLASYVPYKEKRLAQLRQEINARRRADAEQQARRAAEVAASLQTGALKELAEHNKQLAERRQLVVAETATITKQLDDVNSRLNRLRTQFDRAQDQVTPDELSYYSGQLLRQQQAQLPNIHTLKRENAARRSVLSDALVSIFELNDQRSELANLDEMVNQIAARTGDLSDEVRQEARQLLEAKRDILESLLRSYETYSENLNKLDSAESQLIATTKSYADFIAERVLWIRSCAPLHLRDLGPAATAAAWSLDPRHWRDAGLAILGAGARQPIMFTLFVIGFTALMFVQRPARRRLLEVGAEAEKRSCSKLRPTLHAVWLTALIALPWPALLAFLAWAMDSYSETEFVRSLSVATRFTAVCLLMLEVIRHLCRREGLADAHFDWPEPCLLFLRCKLRWLVALGLPLVLWLVGLETQTELPLASETLGRACFILAMLLLAVVMYRILLVRNSPFRQLVLYSEGGWLKPLQLAWRPVLVLLPASLAALAAVGYYYTAQQAVLRALQTAAMILAVLTLGGLTRRWLLVNRRRLAREQAKQRRAQLAAAAEADAASPPAAEAIDEAVNLAALSEQTQKLVRTFLAITTVVGLVLIWAEILPALAYPAGRLLPGAEELTWGHLGAFLLVLAVTYITVRDVPALLELVILQHLPLDSGARYAITSMSRYILTAIGLTVAFNAIGGQWSKIQWLVAAMGVGLGFGLQEIFANFVSGIILLFERPIRIGDIVTLGETSGVVTRIRMRATTIVDWDKKEFLVPNKDLVTGRLLNWTLTDHLNRIAIGIGISYESDTKLACELLLEAAREQPHILKEPPPVAFFDNFGDSALNLKLFCFLPNLENRWLTIHNLNSTINAKFKAAGVEIPFPQRDLNLKFDRDNLAIDVESASIVFGQDHDAAKKLTADKGRSKSADRHGAA